MRYSVSYVMTYDWHNIKKPKHTQLTFVVLVKLVTFKHTNWKKYVFGRTEPGVILDQLHPAFGWWPQWFGFFSKIYFFKGSVKML